MRVTIAGGGEGALDSPFGSKPGDDSAALHGWWWVRADSGGVCLKSPAQLSPIRAPPTAASALGLGDRVTAGGKPGVIHAAFGDLPGDQSPALVGWWWVRLDEGRVVLEAPARVVAAPDLPQPQQKASAAEDAPGDKKDKKGKKEKKNKKEKKEQAGGEVGVAELRAELAAAHDAAVQHEDRALCNARCPSAHPLAHRQRGDGYRRRCRRCGAEELEEHADGYAHCPVCPWPGYDACLRCFAAVQGDLPAAKRRRLEGDARRPPAELGASAPAPRKHRATPAPAPDPEPEDSQRGQLQSPAEGFDTTSCPAIVGTLTALEKRYARPAAGEAPDPALVRPPEVLERALRRVMEQRKLKETEEEERLYCWEQLKSIRHDLTVQHVFTPFTTEVYETHARVSLEHGDLGEFSACQGQLRAFHARPWMVATQDSVSEFAAYRILYCATASTSDLAMELRQAAVRWGSLKEAPAAVRHALAVARAVMPPNAAALHRLLHGAPHMQGRLCELLSQQRRGLRGVLYGHMLRAYRPAVPRALLAPTLLFTQPENGDGAEAVEEFLKLHGAVTGENGDVVSAASAAAFVQREKWVQSRRDFTGDDDT
eukprot:TRINITY_DN28838_c0_g1_i2.p1 TRINITY_DN28838_c0_g1~~TRINITY_DN28838_c0_g1_i2.p1  ORF type:complete len:648 (+),score=149.52 TRINITY_DN28838_c0_g1_i2:152-1945(+)